MTFFAEVNAVCSGTFIFLSLLLFESIVGSNSVHQVKTRNRFWHMFFDDA